MGVNRGSWVSVCDSGEKRYLEVCHPSVSCQSKKKGCLITGWISTSVKPLTDMYSECEGMLLMTGVTRMSSHQEEMKCGTCSFL